MPIIEMTNVTKVYPSRRKQPEVRALDGLDLTVEQGTVRALLGPNGAGKTTTVKVLSTLTTPTSGTAIIDGVSVIDHPQQTRRMIGASGQYATVDEKLTARENLMLIARLFHLGSQGAKQRTAELLEAFNLVEPADRPVGGFSGGMRRRIDLAASLVNDPKILILDEPTTGLDPAARLALWEIIRQRVAAGTTLLLTTQYLEEADQLADDISVIDHGRVIAEGTPDELKAQVGGQRISVTCQTDEAIGQLTNIVTATSHDPRSVVTKGRTVSAAVHDGQHALAAVLAETNAAGIALHDAGMQRPTLDDVFVTLTQSDSTSA
ncbi:ATP-binding cassette domain-containing protein [Corynebacterium choanae]|uniref:Daunorubicin/doxorubicin resistance ATP-binding protein DrrA n=1 Tax=Corynebacterium choanae TaxID=1862358 RepID=A0A3G6J8W0_9CORY|nr:ATP-binding cassette domain-containing protein [Corynebacterium choanae]AZA14213.1 Daunorubicin/doxorubicin resistance ATP-binding protein DrrA [Corynebacterium choanae]